MLIPTGYGQLNLIFTGDTVPTGAQVTLGFENVADEASPTAILSEFATILEGCTDLWATTQANVKCSQLLVKLGPNATGPSATLSVDFDGTYSSTDASPAVCYLIRKNTAMGGRQGRGRIYWPGVPLQDVDLGGVLESNLVTGQNSGWTEFFVESTTAQYPPVLLRAEASPINTPEPITGFSCQSVVATQRRRQRR